MFLSIYRFGIYNAGNKKRETLRALSLCRRPSSTSLAKNGKYLLVLFQPGIRATAYRANHPLFQVSLDKSSKRLLVRSAHKNCPTIFNRRIYRKLTAKIIKKVIRVASQEVRKFHKIEPESLLTRNHRMGGRQL